MPTDALLQLQPATTKAATFHGAGFVLAAGTPRWNLFARVIYSAATSTGSDTATFSVDVSYDGGSTFLSDFVAPPIALTSTPVAGEIFIPFSISPTSSTATCQIRLSVVLTTNGTTSITYVGDTQFVQDHR